MRRLSSWARRLWNDTATRTSLAALFTVTSMTLSIASTICITLRSRDYNPIHPTSRAYPLLLKASFACCSEMTFVPVNLGKILFKMAS